MTSYPWSPQGKMTMQSPEVCPASYTMCPHHPSLRHSGHLWLQNALSSSPASLTTSHPSLQSATTSQHQPNKVQIEVCCAMAMPTIPAPPPSTVPLSPQASGPARQPQLSHTALLFLPPPPLECHPRPWNSGSSSLTTPHPSSVSLHLLPKHLEPFGATWLSLILSL